MSIRNKLKELALTELGRPLTDDELDTLEIQYNVNEGIVPSDLPETPSNLTAPSEPEDIMLDEAVPPQDFLPQGSPAQMEAGQKKLAKAAGLGAGLAGAAALPTMSGKSIFNALGLPGQTAGLAGGKLVSDVVSAAPSLAYGSAVARQLKENMLADVNKNDIPDIQEAAMTEYSQAKDKGTVRGYLGGFGDTAEMGARALGGSAVPEEAENLLSTLGRALKGAVGGGVTSLQRITKPAASTISGIKKEIAPLAEDPIIKTLAAIAGVSDKAPAAGLASNLLFGKDITRSDRMGIVGEDTYLNALDTQAQSIINTPVQGRTAEQIKFLESYPENRRAYLASLEQKSKTEQEMKSGSLNMGNMDPKSEQAKEMTRWISASKDIDNMDDQIKFAMEKKDPSVMALVVNKLAGISSVAIQQGVVSDEEARRVLSGVMSNFEQVQAAGFSTASVQRFLDSSAWKSVINMSKGVNNGLKARMQSYKDIYSIPEEFFTRAKVDLKPSDYSESNAITQQDLDKLNEKAALEAARIKYLTGGQAVPTALESALDGLNKWWEKRQKDLFSTGDTTTTPKEVKPKSTSKPSPKKNRRRLGE